MKIRLAAIALLAFAAAPLQAQFTPTGTSFGALPVATFGGSGIPNTSVQLNTSIDGLSLGLSAAQRGTNVGVTDNGAGRFFASPGNDLSVAPTAVPGYATWNFNFYVGGNVVGRYNYRLFYDFDAAVSNSVASHGFVAITGTPNSTAAIQNSWNLGMGFLSSGLFGAAPTPNTFNPNSGGEYSFALIAYEKTGTGGLGYGSEVARSAIIVSTTTVPEPSTYVLMASGLVGLCVAHRRRNA